MVLSQRLDKRARFLDNGKTLCSSFYRHVGAALVASSMLIGTKQAVTRYGVFIYYSSFTLFRVLRHQNKHEPTSLAPNSVKRVLQ